jgi:UDP-N-acetylmuramoyl-tripeptide--D-alanyl-D-alanine ligase
MKSILKKIIVEIVSFESRLVLKKYKPFIIAVTGSVGKTSTKDAIYTALSSTYNVRKSEKSFNSELGVPLTILGCPNGWSSLVVWMKNILHGLELIIFTNPYPKYLILEIGADRPGDIQQITSWLRPDISVITKVGKVAAHVEYFPNPEALAKEKAYLAKGLKKDGILILSADDEIVSKITAEQAKETIHFGLALNAKNISSSLMGMSMTLVIEGEEKTIQTKGVVGTHHVYPVIVAAIVAKKMGIPLDTIVKSLESHISPRGRMNVLKGKNNITILDDTYNSSPDAVYSALETLKELQGARKVAILGDMLELGKYAVEAHVKVGEAARQSANLVISVGLRSRGMNAQHHFNTSIEAAEKVPALLRDGDIVLVKGSQGIRMERVVKALLDPSLNPKDYLVRQEPEWLSR